MRTLIVVLFALTISLPAMGRTIEGVTVPETVKVDGQTLALNGAVLLEATILAIDVYVISLYRLQKTRSAAAVLQCDQPLKVTKRFVRDVDRSDLVPPWRKMTRKRGRKIGVDINASLEKLLSGLRSISDGQTLALTWRPGKGLEVSIDGRITARVEDARAGFCKAVFSGYVGSMASDDDVAEALVGG